MKTFGLVVASATAFAAADTTECDSTVVERVLNGTYVVQCNVDSGFTSQEMPDAATWAEICDSSSCYGIVVALDLGDCTIDSIVDLIVTSESTCGSASGSRLPQQHQKQLCVVQHHRFGISCDHVAIYQFIQRQPRHGKH